MVFDKKIKINEISCLIDPENNFLNVTFILIFLFSKKFNSFIRLVI